ncbi:MAG TPA: VIT domain-containing protein, partial [Allosphingosinicella sp.]|nr:VIT domain-containing protein [Allosphingosinicella sp.]
GLMAVLQQADSAFAQTASPALTARIQGVRSEEAQSRKLRIERLNVDVRIHGTIAETTITARFDNPGESILEGDFTLMMPAGAVVAGYALDVAGRLVDGVLVEQRQARIAYEARVRQRIDPGLAEVDRGNLFRTRIFPISPHSGRTVRLRFVSPLDRRAGYVLPLRKTEEIGTFAVTIEATGVARVPDVRIPAAGEGDWNDGGRRFAFEARSVQLDGDLQIGWAAPAAPLLVSRHSNGESFFQIADEGPARTRADAPRPRSVTILWDRSLSRRDDNLDEEVAVLRQYLEQVRPQRIELRLFDATTVESSQASTIDALVNRVRTVTYRGATGLDRLAAEPVRADACLLFSDGLVTIGRREVFHPECPLFALSSAADADRPFLASLARDSGGETYDLTVREAGEALARMTRAVPRVADVRSAAGQRIEYSLLEAGENGWRIVGRMPASGEIRVRLSGLGGGETERLYSASGPAAEADGPGALWAAERAALMAASDEPDREALLAFSRSYSVASPDVSFLVLETGRDYAMSHIDPPANLQPELLDEYRRVRDEMKQSETEARGRRLQTVLAQ